MPDCDVALIGAGPYGLAAAAHLRCIKALDVRVFGEPLDFWRTSMPRGMLLRSSWSASSIADPDSALTLDAYKQVSGNHLGLPISLERFVNYGLWFQRSTIPEIDRTQVGLIEAERHGFRLNLCDGRTLTSARVVVAAGISPFAFRPAVFDLLPPPLVSHTSELKNLDQFTGKRVAVIGGGQSALETAALLHERGASVEVLVRKPRVHWLGWKDRLHKLGPLSKALFSSDDVGPAAVSRLVAVPALLNALPRSVQNALRDVCLRPAGARWLRERIRNVRLTPGKVVIEAKSIGHSLRLLLSDGSARLVDHAVLGTGYRVDVARYRFLSPIIDKVNVIQGFPQLDRGFQSSVSGLYFLGAPAAWTFGPLMYFVSGTRYCASTLSHFLQCKRNGREGWAF